MDYLQSGKPVSIEGLKKLPGAIYVRVSLDDKQEIESQIGAVKNWCEKHKLTVPKARTFEDLIGYTPRHRWDRPAFEKLEAEVKAGRIAWVVVWNQKRFGGGDPWHFAAKIQEFRNAGCQVWDVEGRCLSADDAYSFIQGGLNATSSRDEVITRTKDSMRSKLALAKRGVYPGGYVPFGLDIACLRKEGSERWRIIVEGHHKRLQVWPDGRSERWDGKGSFPSTQEGDELFLQPTHDRTKIEVVRSIFETYATQEISTYLIARMLNRQGSHPTYSKSWQASHVESVLKNSVYRGRPSWSKQGQGQHLEYVNGEFSTVEKTTGRRWRTTDQHILSEKPIFDPDVFISKKTWEAVRAKLPTDDSQRPKRAPKSASGWLAGLVFCKGCGLKMRGQIRPTFFQFSCYSYDKTRDSGKIVCARNSISQDKIEEHLWKYLEETSQAAEVLSKAATVGDLELLATVPESLEPLFDRLQELVRKMVAVVRPDVSSLSEAVEEDSAAVALAEDLLKAGNLGEAKSVIETTKARHQKERLELLASYREAIRGSRDEMESRKLELEAEYENLKATLIRTTNQRMLSSLNADIERVSTELDSIESHLGSLEEDYESSVRSINAFVDSVKEALREKGSSQPRVLAAEVGKIIERIEVEFEPTGLKYPQSRPVAITFIPKFSLGSQGTKTVLHSSNPHSNIWTDVLQVTYRF